jgi:hypothetical protein
MDVISDPGRCLEALGGLDPDDPGRSELQALFRAQQVALATGGALAVAVLTEAGVETITVRLADPGTSDPSGR